jgi:MarC family membrane protein
VLTGVLSFTFSTLTTLLLVVDAPAAVPLFLSMTESDTLEHKRRTAFRASLAAGVVLAAFGAAGGAIFRVLGISLGAFRIAGGVLLFLLAIDMLRAQRSRQRTSPEEEAEGVDRPDVSIFPLAIPMLAGPGATSTDMVLVSRAARLAIPGRVRRDRGDLVDHARSAAQRPARRAPTRPDRHERAPARDGPDPGRDRGAVRGRGRGDVVAHGGGGIGKRARHALMRSGHNGTTNCCK